MRSFTLALAAMAVAGVSAQLDWAKLNAPGAAEYYYGIIPKCVVGCTKKALAADDCPIDDFACHCQKGTQKITDVIGPCLASNTTMCLQSELSNFGALVEGLCSYLNTTHMEPTPVPTSYTTTTQLVTITSCPPTVTDCPVGKVVTSTIVVPCSATTTPAPPVITTPPPPMISSSSTPVTSYTTTTQVITVTSCPPTVTNCPIGKVITSTITVPCDTSSMPPPPITTPTPPIIYTTSVPYANTTMTRTRTKSRSSSMSSASSMSSMSASTSMMSSMSSSTRTHTKTRSSSMSSMSSMSASTSTGMTSYITTTYTVTGSCSGCPYPVTTTIPVIPVVSTGGPTPPANMTTPVMSYTPTSSMPAVWTGAASNLKVGGAIGAVAIGALMAL